MLAFKNKRMTFLPSVLATLLLWKRQRRLWSRDQLQSHQSRQLQKLREHTYRHSPFYRNFHKGLFHSPLHELPVLTKATVMENFDELVTDRTIRLDQVEGHLSGLDTPQLFRNRYTVINTAGTTGRQGIFLWNSSEWFWYMVSSVRGAVAGCQKAWLEAVVKRTPIAYVGSTLVQAQWILQALSSWWSPTRALDITRPAESTLRELNLLKPGVLLCFASRFPALIDAQRSGLLDIAPKLVFNISELFSKQLRRDIENTWGIRPFDLYGTTECGVLGFDCELHSGLHLAEDMVITEIVDKEYRPVPRGSCGDKILVTVLFNHTQPLIRYEIEDRLRLYSEACPCGRPSRVISEVVGREFDLLELKGQSGQPIEIHRLVFDEVFLSLPTCGWQVTE